MLWPKATLALEDRRKWERGELVHRDVDKELRGMGVSLNLGIHRDTPVGLGRQDAPSGSAKDEHLTMPAASAFSHVAKPAKRPVSAPPWRISVLSSNVPRTSTTLSSPRLSQQVYLL